ncbi:tRNA(Ile)-lysidine synthase [Spirochaetota bacterium]|nr:tRNA(Ile)-lysidine synthase [Spirochaetota bacterium]
MNLSLPARVEKCIFKAFTEKRLQDKRCLLLVSGGVDSMVLLFVMHRLYTRGAIASFEVLHFNYALRSEAKLDTDLVVATCKKFDLSLHVRHSSLPIRKASSNKTINVQAAARNLRYDEGRTLLATRDLAVIITAYHGDDNIETLLWKMGTVKSLHALTKPNELADKIFRPCLSLWKADLLAYAQHEKIPYRNDNTNRNTAYLRNALRHKVIPPFTEVLPKVKSALSVFQDRLRDAHNLEEKLLYSTRTLICVDKTILLGAGFWNRTPFMALNNNDNNNNNKSNIMLTRAERLSILHGALMKSYPERRFSKGEILEIFKKLGTGTARKQLFSSPTLGAVYYSRNIIAPLNKERPKYVKNVLLRKDSQHVNLTQNASVEAYSPNTEDHADNQPTTYDLVGNGSGIVFNGGQLAIISENINNKHHEKTHAIKTNTTEADITETHATKDSISVAKLDLHTVPMIRLKRIMGTEPFTWRGMKKAVGQILRDLKLPYQCQKDSWMITLTMRYSAYYHRDEIASSLDKSHHKAGIQRLKPPQELNMGIFSPYALYLHHHDLLSINEMTSPLLCYDDHWLAWRQKWKENDGKQSDSKQNNVIGEQYAFSVQLPPIQRANWYLVWKSQSLSK